MTDMPMAPSRLSKSSLFSLIIGILICLPLGPLAVLLGIIGFFKSGAPGVKGRWMAVVGGILGVGSTIAWVVAIAVGGLAFLGIGALRAPVTATHDFVRDLSAGDVAAAKVIGPGFDDAAIGRLVDYCKAQGTFVDTTLSNVNIVNDTAHVEGTVQFSKGTQTLTADLEKVNGKWQVVKIDFKP